MIDFHTHTFLSDGELVPAEHIRRAEVHGYRVLGLSDHADFADTMRYIYGSGAKTVICANANPGAAANYLRSVGINAIEKGAANPGVQTKLAGVQA